MAEHTIVITLSDNEHAVPMPGKSIVHVGDTLRYDTNPPDLPFRVVLPGSPFFPEAALVISDRNPRLLVQPGRFFWQCFLTVSDGTPNGKKEVGWSPTEEPMESGGDVDVRPRP